ncbi:MAG: FkbM family methyltransferase [Candidatus Azobacteroides sp.]|nr:FkbM family methyltransferase [Candidatus Azobacteroides sp.]
MTLRTLVRKNIHNFFPSLLYAFTSYSQEGEDMVVKSLFENKKGYKGFYVDIGAHHPFRFSNTAYFYKKGWRGINIEPTPGAINIFNRFRKKDINIQGAIGLSDKPLLFYQFNEPALNGFDKRLSESRHHGDNKYEIINTTEIAVSKLSTVLDSCLEEGKKIDFLTLDVEGMEMEVLKSNDWFKYKPDYIFLIEEHTSIVDTIGNEIYTYLKGLNYSFIAKTPRTSIYKYNKDL